MDTGDQVTPRSAGALTFSPDGVLFVGDSKLGAVFAFETERGQAPASLDPFIFEAIDEKIAAALGVTVGTVKARALARMREVPGSALFFSHRTVASHLYRIFPKLGITSRAQLAGVLRVVDGADADPLPAP